MNDPSRHDLKRKTKEVRLVEHALRMIARLLGRHLARRWPVNRDVPADKTARTGDDDDDQGGST